jgi:hypothetical protein
MYVTGQHLAPPVLTKQKHPNPYYPLDRRLDVPQTRFGLLEEQINLLHLQGIDS